MSTNLSTGAPVNSSSLTTTQDPQAPNNQSSLQAGTPGTTLTSGGGVPLKTQAGPAVTLSSSTLSTQPATPVNQHHLNGGLVAVAILLFVTAVVLFASTTMSAKNTTK